VAVHLGLRQASSQPGLLPHAPLYTHPVSPFSPAILFRHAEILTGIDLLTAEPERVQSLLVRDGVIAAAGSFDEIARDLPPGTEHIALDGACVLPGFNDAHLHLGEGARLKREIDLSGAATLEEAMGRIARARTAAVDAAAPVRWLTGGGWDESLWADRVLPTRYDLDRVTGGYPAIFVRIDVHVAVANSAALALGGISRETIAPDGSSIDKDAYGEPTGILRERGARQLVEQHIPPVTQADRMQGLRLVLAEALSLGLTSVQDNSTDDDFAAICALYEAGELPLRVAEWLPFDAPIAELRERQRRAPQSRYLRTTMLKAFLDGSLGSRTAALHAPYADSASTTGLAFYQQETLSKMAAERVVAGFALGFHAIGDRALAMALKAFSAARAACAAESRTKDTVAMPRLRIEHAQTAQPGAFAQAAALGCIASIQPAHLLSDARWVAQRLGPGRTATAYAWRSFAEARVPLAFGTDYPVEPLSPFPGLYAAATRAPRPADAALDPTPHAVFHPEQRLSIAEGLEAATLGAAYAEGAESWKGLLQPGYVADFIVLDRDPLRVNPADLLATRVLRTVVGGRTVFTAT
jgi:predicted amidohydrolase YtcJ